MSRAGAIGGGNIRAGSILRGLSSLMKHGLKPTWLRCGGGRAKAKD